MARHVCVSQTCTLDLCLSIYDSYPVLRQDVRLISLWRLNIWNFRSIRLAGKTEFLTETHLTFVDTTTLYAEKKKLAPHWNFILTVTMLFPFLFHFGSTCTRIISPFQCSAFYVIREICGTRVRTRIIRVIRMNVFCSMKINRYRCEHLLNFAPNIALCFRAKTENLRNAIFKLAELSLSHDLCDCYSSYYMSTCCILLELHACLDRRRTDWKAYMFEFTSRFFRNTRRCQQTSSTFRDRWLNKRKFSGGQFIANSSQVTFWYGNLPFEITSCENVKKCENTSESEFSRIPGGDIV